MGGASAGSGNADLAALELRIEWRWMTQEHEDRGERVLRNASVTVTRPEPAVSQSAYWDHFSGGQHPTGRTDLEAC